jgi:23S rRNA (uracil1939-C5)-methyltransferase
MKKGQIGEGIVEKLEFPNKGTLTAEGEKVVIKGVIPGQKVRFSVTKKRNGKILGRLLEVIERSSLENRDARCPHYGDCGGCSYQNLDYNNQLKIKEEQVKSIMDDVCDDYIFEGIKGSPDEWFYRNKMEFSFGDEYKDGPLALGLHKKNSFHDIVTVSDCKIVHEDINIILRETLNHFQTRNVPFYHKMRHEGYLRHVLIRRAITTGEIIVNLVTTSASDTDLELKKNADFCSLMDKLLKLDLDGNIVGIMHIINDSQADVVKSDRTDILYGRDYIYEKILGLIFKISTFSFFQTNSLGAEVLYEKAREFAGETKDKTIFDLYSGTGTIAQMLAPVAKKVVGVEIVEEAVMAARENAALNHLNNCEFIAGDVLKVIDAIEDKPDMIILDPPRDGIHPKALLKIIDFGVDNIVYISCKPTSLARDLVVLQEKGYKVKRVCVVDLFSQTYHTETICLLNRIK